tara:strand:- start:32 stop:472 length:441 start_codon:yes stop_codon:yes gene_type:complete
MRTKGIGPRNLGISKTSPLKQTNQERLAEIKLTRNRLANEGKKKKDKPKYETIDPNDFPTLGASGGLGVIGGGAKLLGKAITKLAGSLAKNPRTARLADKINIPHHIKVRKAKKAKELKDQIKNTGHINLKYASKRGQRRPDGTRY